MARALHFVAFHGIIRGVNDETLRSKVRGVIDSATDQIVTISKQHADELAVQRMREARKRHQAASRRDAYGSNPQFPKEKEGLEFMIQSRKKGHGYRIIAEMMERQGFQTRRGLYWNPGSVMRILKRHGVK